MQILWVADNIVRVFANEQVIPIVKLSNLFGRHENVYFEAINAIRFSCIVYNNGVN